MSLFQSLDDFASTRNALQFFARLLGEVAKAHAIAHPKWRHIGLSVEPNGLRTGVLPLPGGGIAALRIDVRHKIVLESSREFSREISLFGRKNAQEIAGEFMSAVRDMGLPTKIDPTLLPDVLDYDPEKSAAFFHTLVEVDRIFKQRIAQLEPVSPVLLWPHGFDLSCEWYGSRMVEWEEDGIKSKIPSQLNLGFYPGAHDADSYFYSNPWPFDEARLLDKPLPPGARWHTDGWKGTMLPYTEVLNDPEPEARLLQFARAVYDIAAPTLN